MRMNLPLLAGLALVSLSFTSGAQPLRDPTRPPADASSAMSKPAAQSGSRNRMILQTVVISAERRKAVISGRVMSVGDTLFGFRLAAIREGEVVMKGSKGTRILRLYPAVNKVTAKMATALENTRGSE